MSETPKKRGSRGKRRGGWRRGPGRRGDGRVAEGARKQAVGTSVESQATTTAQDGSIWNASTDGTQATQPPVAPDTPVVADTTPPSVPAAGNASSNNNASSAVDGDVMEALAGLQVGGNVSRTVVYRASSSDSEDGDGGQGSGGVVATQPPAVSGGGVGTSGSTGALTFRKDAPAFVPRRVASSGVASSGAAGSGGDGNAAKPRFRINAPSFTPTFTPAARPAASYQPYGAGAGAGAGGGAGAGAYMGVRGGGGASPATTASDGDDAYAFFQAIGGQSDDSDDEAAAWDLVQTYSIAPPMAADHAEAYVAESYVPDPVAGAKLWGPAPPAGAPFRNPPPTTTTTGGGGGGGDSYTGAELMGLSVDGRRTTVVNYRMSDDEDEDEGNAQQ